MYPCCFCFTESSSNKTDLWCSPFQGSQRLQIHSILNFYKSKSKWSNFLFTCTQIINVPVINVFLTQLNVAGNSITKTLLNRSTCEWYYPLSTSEPNYDPDCWQPENQLVKGNSLFL